ncbi:MAG: GNAT family N-acetyltransferase [Deltaproteobacteria bacterium]|nr:GNAT family N-acetyltransferase [Deltaproteobacteria bacterium]
MSERDARFAQIETARLLCEPVRGEHASAMFPVLSDARLYAHMPGGPPESVAALEREYAFLAGGRSPDGAQHWLNWILRLRDSREAIGFTQATLRGEGGSIAYVIGAAHQRRGYAREAVAALVAHLFEVWGVARLQAEIHFDNRASAGLAQRLGFLHARKDFAENDDIFELTRAAWLARSPLR